MAILGIEAGLIEAGLIEAGFWVMLFRGPRLLLCGPYYTVLLYCMITKLMTITTDISAAEIFYCRSQHLNFKKFLDCLT